MKWFKHMTAASDDLFVRDLERKFGDAGYVFWFKTLELIGAHGKEGTVVVSWDNYCETLRKRKMVIRRLLDYCVTNNHLTFVDVSEESVKITCKRFAEIADNYHKYDGLSSKRLQRHFEVSSKQEEEGEVEEEEKEKKKEKKSGLVEGIDSFESLRNNRFVEIWEEWIVFRKEKKKPLTDRQAVKQLKWLSEQKYPVEIIEQSIRNGWQGLFELRDKPNGTYRTSDTRPTAAKAERNKYAGLAERDARSHASDTPKHTTEVQGEDP